MGFVAQHGSNGSDDIDVHMDYGDERSLASLSVTSEHASTMQDSTNVDRYDKNTHIEIARREERNVVWIRTITLVIVIICAVGVCTMVYFFAISSDQNDFEIEVRVSKSYMR
jgi:hypothetical protein